MKKVFCWLTGGHRYADKNLQSTYIHKQRKTLIVNHCVKCNKRFIFLLDTDRLLQREVEMMKKRLSFLPIDENRGDTK